MVGDSVFGRRRRQVRARCHSVRFDLSDIEYAELAAAARNAGLARGAFAAKAALEAARASSGSSTTGSWGASDPCDLGLLRELLAEVVRASTLVQRAGVNLNQAVAALNATGQAPGSLVPAAEHCSRVVDRLDQVAEQVRAKVR